MIFLYDIFDFRVKKEQKKSPLGQSIIYSKSLSYVKMIPVTDNKYLMLTRSIHDA